jgi:4-hydroxy-3-methylbut-2-enyl diphosphate reductase IspH
VIGTLGQVPEGTITLVETVEDVATCPSMMRWVS